MEKVQLKSEASGSEKMDDVKDELKVDEKKEGSDDEEEEERSWRRGYDAE